MDSDKKYIFPDTKQPVSFSHIISDLFLVGVENNIYKRSYHLLFSNGWELEIEYKDHSLWTEISEFAEFIEAWLIKHRGFPIADESTNSPEVMLDECFEESEQDCSFVCEHCGR